MAQELSAKALYILFYGHFTIDYQWLNIKTINLISEIRFKAKIAKIFSNIALWQMNTSKAVGHR
jgi:hypothetical protein